MNTVRMKKQIRRKWRRMKRFFRKKVFNLLLAIYEGDIRFSLLSLVVSVFFLFLFVGLFLPKKYHQEPVSPAAVFGSELTHAVSDASVWKGSAEGNGSILLPPADVTMFLLPNLLDGNACEEVFPERLCGFYLSGKELKYLPEYNVSLTDKKNGGKTAYLGGLSYTYNPYRFTYNRTTEVRLYHADGSLSPIDDRSLYYVIAGENILPLFDAISRKSFRLISIRPKDADGNPISFDRTILYDRAQKALSIGDIYGGYLLSGSSAFYNQPADSVVRCSSLNTVALFSGCNGIGLFLIGCFVYLFAMAYLLRPYLRRLIIKYRVYRIHRRKREKFTLKRRIVWFQKNPAYFLKKILTNRTA